MKEMIKKTLRGLLSKEENPKVREFVQFYLQVLNALDPQEEDPRRISSHLYLNLKLALSCGASWVQGQERRWEANKMIYSSSYNRARDIVRRALEQAALQEQGESGPFWDHLEIFLTRDMVPRKEGEKAREAHRRALRERSLPLLEEFLLVANATNKLQFLRALIQGGWTESPEKLLYLEALCSTYKEQELQEEGLGTFSQRKNIIRWVRQVRWGDVNPQRELARLEALKKLPRVAGPILRGNMPRLLELLDRGASLEELRQFVEEVVGERAEPILRLLEEAFG